MMSGKIKGFALDIEKARLKHHHLMQDYNELHEEVNAMRSRLEAANRRKLILTAEVRFLRRRRRCLVENNKAARPAQEQPHAHALAPPHQTKSTKKKRHIAAKEAAAASAANKGTLPSSLVAANPKKQRKATQQVTPSSPAMNRARKRVFDDGAKEPKSHSFTIPISDLNHRESRLLDLNQKQRTLRNPVVSFDLNLGSAHSVGEPQSLKAPIFDLNEISTGEEEVYGNVDSNGRFELESVKGVMKGSLHCSPSRVGKRKISWQDPVALRV